MKLLGLEKTRRERVIQTQPPADGLRIVMVKPTSFSPNFSSKLVIEFQIWRPLSKCTTIMAFRYSGRRATLPSSATTASPMADSGTRCSRARSASSASSSVKCIQDWVTAITLGNTANENVQINFNKNLVSESFSF